MMRIQMRTETDQIRQKVLIFFGQPTSGLALNYEECLRLSEDLATRAEHIKPAPGVGYIGVTRDPEMGV